MIAILDVQYDGDDANGGMVLIEHWTDKEPSLTFQNQVGNCAGYQPGKFYQRELPVLLDLLKQTDKLLRFAVVDAHVDLEADTPGLGRYLYDSLSGINVIGVAKSRYRESGFATEILRGESTRPLFITSAGIDCADAASHIESMHGEHRIPDMIKLADSVARGHEIS